MRSINIDLTLTGKRIYTAMKEGWPVIINEGGARSSKTYSTIQLLTLAALQEKLRISIVSHSLPHIKRGAYRDFHEIMLGWGLWNDEEFSYTEYVYEFKNNSYIEFIGLEDEGKARGPSRDILFINEANLIRKQLYDQLAMRTTRQIILDLNPADQDCWVYDVADDTTNKKIHSTYLDNKIWKNGQWVSNLSDFQRRAIEAYKDGDPFLWEVYGLGLRGKSTVTIYTHWKLCQDLPGKGELIYGQDFGYVAPAACVAVEIYDGSIYVDEVLYESKLSNEQIVARYEQRGISKSDYIYCDAAEPKTIDEIKKFGYNVHPADKDVWAGIQKIKSMPLYITERSANILREVKKYKWKTDKNDVILPTEEPVKLDDHALDALRYAVFTHLTQPQYDWVAF